MTIVLFILMSVLLLGLLVVAAMAPHRSRLSAYELQRRHEEGHGQVALDLRRESLYGDIISIQRVLLAVLLVGITLTSVGAFGWLLGGLIAVFLSLEYAMLASFGSVRRLAATLYDRNEQAILDFVAAHQGIVRWMRGALPAAERNRIDSPEELEHMVSESTGILAEDEKKLILASLKFHAKTVHEIMTPKSVVDTIRSSEVLGPLVLDDLHKTGHSRFPVIAEDIDHIVGILYVRDVLTLDTTRKQSAKVESAMSKKVYYIREDHTLDQALSAFLSTHHHLFIVINEFRETVGIVTLEDTLEALLGRRIVDEFDAHDDMRAVATRNAAKRGTGSRHHDATEV